MPEATDPPKLAQALEHHRAGRLAEAEVIYASLLAAHPGHPELLHLLGLVAHQSSRSEAGAELIRRAIAARPASALYHNNLGVVLASLGQYDQARAAHEMAIKLQPEYPEAFYNLGNVRRARGEWDDAVTAFRTALSQRPGYVLALDNLGGALKELGDLSGAMACFRQAIELAPDAAATHSNLVYLRHFDPAADAGQLREESERWDRRHGEPLRTLHLPHSNLPDAERRLKVGYVSPNFSRHVICQFLTPLLEAHDKSAFEIFCYSSVQRPDGVTERLQKSASVWREVRALDDEALARRIREDGIDILVDLTQHMAEIRLRLFARKPAPVQVAWLGYPGSTGLRSMDYRLTDARMEPEGSPWSESVEKVVRLPDSWFCFDPMDEYPTAGGLPALREGYVTFASLNNFCKVNEPVLRLWAKVLLAVEGSRLLLQCPPGAHGERVRQFFEAQGIARERVTPVLRTATREEFLQVFQRIDLALDPFPYNGGTTTCEALWMGVPVLALPGSRIVSRIGLSILSAVGLPELAAESEAEYVCLAAALAGDLPHLAELRANLRARMRASRFMDGPRFARNVERAYREMWRSWCVERVTNDEKKAGGQL